MNSIDDTNDYLSNQNSEMLHSQPDDNMQQSTEFNYDEDKIHPRTSLSDVPNYSTSTKSSSSSITSSSSLNSSISSLNSKSRKAANSLLSSSIENFKRKNELERKMREAELRKSKLTELKTNKVMERNNKKLKKSSVIKEKKFMINQNNVDKSNKLKESTQELLMLKKVTQSIFKEKVRNYIEDQKLKKEKEEKLLKKFQLEIEVRFYFKLFSKYYTFYAYLFFSCSFFSYCPFY